jgi:hypothetical protein
MQTDAIKTNGDRMLLNGTERAKLENDILPTARRWAMTRGNLAEHGIKTLEYWGETVAPDRNEYRNQ